jgi:aspartyl protease family protein
MLRTLMHLAIAALLMLVALDGRQLLRVLSAQWPLPLHEPTVEPAAPSGSLTVPADRNGHFLLTAQVNGTPVRFLVDTGASSIVLSRSDAARIGLSPGETDFTRLYNTPGGIVRAAPVRLAEFQVGALRLRNVGASVSQNPMDVSLLGISFLTRLKSYEVSDGRMTLRW